MKNNVSKFFTSQFFDYLLVYLLIATSGIMFFYRNDEHIVLGFILGAVIFFMRKIKMDPAFFLIMLLFLAIEMLQMTYFNTYSPVSAMGTIARLGFAYFVIKITNKNFINIYINIIYYTAIISLFFYLLTFQSEITKFIIKNIAVYFQPIFPLPGHMNYAYSPNIIVYNYNYEHVAWFRNVGPFWESGAFGVYLNIALLFNLVRNKNIFNRINLVLLVSIFTTVSTAAYLALFFFITAYYLTRKDIKYKIVYIVLAGAVSLYGFFALPFMQEKIQQNIANSDTTTKSRFGSAKADLKVFQMSPVFGLGRTEKIKEKMSKKLGVTAHRNNGITGLLSSYGIIIFLFYFISYYYSIIKYVKRYYKYSNYHLIAQILLFTIFLIGFSQRIFLFPFFYSLTFLHLIDYEPSTNKSANNSLYLEN